VNFTRVLGLDTETTHLEPSRGWPWEWGLTIWAETPAGWVEETGETFIVGIPLDYKGNVRREANLFSLKVAGLKRAWNLIECGEQPDQVVTDITLWLRQYKAQDLPVIAYNAPFDSMQCSELAFLAGDYDRAKKQFNVNALPLSGIWIDPLQLVRNTLPAPHKLAEIAPRLGVGTQGDEHGALADARLAVKVWLALTGKQIAQEAA
jgi:DNA polymerase III epsilon subunit-like protein